ncbi:MAG: hypothetical protein V4735_00435 [Pseudomonadota bacterium]
MKTTLSALSLISLAMLGACASIVEGSTANINVSTPVAANCVFSNGRGSFSAFTPATVPVKKSRTDLNVSCADPRTGAQGQSKIVSDVEPWAFGNILIGGLIGLGVDWGTGAAYDYPETAYVPMTAPVAAAPAPAVLEAAPQAVLPVSGIPTVAPTTVAPVQAAPAPFGAATPAPTH